MFIKVKMDCMNAEDIVEIKVMRQQNSYKQA